MTERRYMYINSTRSAHVVEKTGYTMNGERREFVRALCGRSPDTYPEWSLSFAPTKPICKSCQEVLDWRANLLKRKYRTLEALRSYKGKPWSLPEGCVSTEIKTDKDGILWVCFMGIGLVEFKMTDCDRRTNLFECITDPTKPVLEPLPLFEEPTQ